MEGEEDRRLCMFFEEAKFACEEGGGERERESERQSERSGWKRGGRAGEDLGLGSVVL